LIPIPKSEGPGVPHHHLEGHRNEAARTVREYNVGTVTDRFRFRNTDTIGVADAESDHAFLHDCFVDEGIIDLLIDCDDHRRIILGRTGAGKTALLNKLAEKSSTAIAVQPESLALAYISNSTILRFVHELGVNLDVFFKLLWRHVFTVEIIKAHFHLDSARGSEGVLDWIRGQFSDKKRQHEKALAYLETWGSRFWEQTDYRIEELTTKLERELKASIGGALHIANFDISGDQKLSQEQKAKVVERAMFVVNQVQIQELSYVLELLDSILADPQKRYYIIIDRLDENWVEEGLRYLLIRALIETVRDFRRVRNAKIVISLRHDLIDRVVRMSRDVGFQEEKYESLYFDLNWTQEQLIDLLDLRINRLVRQRYTSQKVTHKDLLPKLIDNIPAIDYILARTLMRPRDVILFFNACIRQASSNPEITPQMLKQAEGEYSRLRLRSLADEWNADFPDLMLCAELLKNRRSSFVLTDITDDECIDLAIKLLGQKSQRKGEFAEVLGDIERDPSKTDSLRKVIASMFYRVGLVGLKLEAYDSFVWSTSGRRSVSAAEIRTGVHLSVHPCFWRSLGINPEVSKV
jgi:hypothetical protein